jgi:hypothetical protein
MHPPATAPAPASTRRLWEIDALRGLMLVLMTVTHIPTRFADPLGQPLGFVSAAEGFVLLSGFVAGMINMQRQLRDGEVAMREAFHKRALKIYAAQAALLLFLLGGVTAMGLALQQQAITDLVSYFLEQPLNALIGGLLLVYNPPLLDILPMYVIFMLASPLLLLHATHHGWAPILVVSAATWLCAQFGLSLAAYDTLVGLVGVPVPFRQTGAFEMLAWQFVWVLGLWMGASQGAQRPVQPLPFPRRWVMVALVVAVVHLVWRHAVGQAPFGAHDSLNMLYDKWRLGPLRLIDFFALIVLAMHFGPRLTARLPKLPLLELLGRQSLPVFCAHVVLAMLLLTSFGAIDPQRPWPVDATLLSGCFLVMVLVARLSDAIDARVAASARRLKDRRAARRQQPVAALATASSSTGDAKSPASTMNIPPG